MDWIGRDIMNRSPYLEGFRFAFESQIEAPNISSAIDKITQANGKDDKCQK